MKKSQPVLRPDSDSALPPTARAIALPSQVDAKGGKDDVQRRLAAMSMQKVGGVLASTATRSTRGDANLVGSWTAG